MSNSSVRPYRVGGTKGEDAEVSARLYGAFAGLAKKICPTVAHRLCGALFLDRDVIFTKSHCYLRRSRSGRNGCVFVFSAFLWDYF